MNQEQRRNRIQELERTIAAADRELIYLGAGVSLGRAVESALAEVAAGEDYKTLGAGLCEQLVAGLNALNDGLEGTVALRSDSFAIGTAVGVITYDADAEEWYFTEDS